MNYVYRYQKMYNKNHFETFKPAGLICIQLNQIVTIDRPKLKNK
jgi:hypothetical protein